VRGVLWVRVRYYMHYRNGLGRIEDEDGRELADDKAARREAIAGARDIMAADVRIGHLDMTAHIEVEDEAHKPLFTIGFADVVTVSRISEG
jgi:hypothetical protein